MFRIHIHRFRWLLVLMLLLAGLFSTIGSAQAFELMEGTIAQGEVIEDDVLISGQTVVVDGTVNGDLFAFGETVTINGTVNGSFFAFAQRIVVRGNIEGTLYGGAGSLTLGSQATIGRNVLFGGFSLDSEAGSSVGRDLLVGAYQALLSGSVGRDVKAGVAALELAGKVGRDVTVGVAAADEGQQISYMTPPDAPPAVEPGLRVSQEAEIGGTLTYHSETEQADTIEAAPAGGVVYKYQEGELSDTETAQEQATFGAQIGGWLLGRVRELATLLILGGLMLWKAPTLFQQLVDKARLQPLPAAGWGVATLIGAFIGAAVITFLIIVLALIFSFITLGELAGTIFGIGFTGLGLLLLIFLLLVFYGSKLVIAYWGGRVALQRFAPQYLEHTYWPLVLGVFLYVILRGIPYVGGLIALIVTLIGLGAMWLLFRGRRTAI